MRLTFKIISMVLLVFLLIITADSIITVSREVHLFYQNLEEEVYVLGNIISDLIIEVWDNSGEEKALSLIKDLNRAEHKNFIQWFWINHSLNDSVVPEITNDLMLELKAGKSFHIKNRDNNSLYYYMPVKIHQDYPGVIEISQSLQKVTRHINLTILKVIVLAVSFILITMLLVWIIGNWYIKAPLEKLGKKLQEISQGQLVSKYYLKTHDELHDLETAINKMVEQLKIAEINTKIETEKRYEVLNQLRHAERLSTIGRIASGIAHEIGTPINVIQGRGQLIHDEDLNPAEIQEYSEIIIQESQRITQIIQQLLNFSRTHKTESSSADISQLIKLVINLLSPIANKNKTTIYYQPEAEMPLVPIDRTQIQQVLMNTIINAIDAMPEGGNIQIITRLTEQLEKNRLIQYLEIQIADHGTGIPQKNINKIFEPFYTTKQKKKGTGLGLSIVQNIIKEHQGYITVESEINKGTCFHFYLPLGLKNEP